MPVAPSSNHAGRALAVAGVALVVVIGGLWAAAALYGRQDATRVRLGDQTFEAGKATNRAKEVTERGPFLVADASPAHDRDIIVQHLGSHPRTGWLAFAAQPPGKPRTCTWQWSKSERRFHAKCDRSLTLPADGQGAKQYPATVDADGQLSVDLNAAKRPSTTTTTSTTTIVISGLNSNSS